MKQKLRKILALLVLSVSVLGLTACGSANDSETIEYDSAYLQSVSDFLIGSWNGLSEADLDTYATMDEEDAQSMLDSYGLPFTAEAFTTAFAGYEGSMEELGAYVSTDGYEFETKKDEVILITHLTYEQRKADLEIVFNKKSVAQSVTVNPEYSLGEILAKAGMNTLLGMGTVFAVLILISLIIYCFNFIPNIQAKFEMCIRDRSMGRLGVLSRLAGTLTGSAMTFASVGEASAPGQIPIEQMRVFCQLLSMK